MRRNISLLLFFSFIFITLFNSCNNDNESTINGYKDPVCGMDIKDSSITHFLEGKMYYFCSKICKESFAASPQNYLSNDELKLCKNFKQEKDYADSVNMGLILVDTLKGSPRRYTCFKNDHIQIDIDYGSPGVKDRVIWGGLVPYNQVWVSGAHNATQITFSNDILIDDKAIAKGTYAIFTIPGKKEWTFILNKKHQQHLADDYNALEDVIRIIVKPRQNKDLIQRLSYEINPAENNNQITVTLKWEHLHIPVLLTIKK